MFTNQKPLKKRYKYRIYPNQAQQESLNKLFGCCRYVYNRLLAENKEATEKAKIFDDKSFLKPVNHFDMNNRIVAWKQEESTRWLSEVCAQALQASAGNLSQAYTHAFKNKKGFPQFKSKYGQQTAEFSNQSYTFKDSKLGLSKINNSIKVKWDRPLPLKGITACTIIKTPSGQYYASFIVEVEKTQTQGQGILGIDAGLSDLFTLSTGEIIKNPRHYVKAQKKLARLQRSHSKKQKGSKNREKSRLKVAKCHQKTANQRKDHLHKLSTRLIRENQAIAVENLKVANMVRNRCLSKHISDAGWGMFRQMLVQKVQSNDGCKLYLADPYYPSTQLCNCCGKKPEPKIKLGVKLWTCLHCLTTHQRDDNAAQNLKLLAERYHKVCKDTIASNVIMTNKHGLLV